MAKRCIFGQPKRQDHDDTAVDPGVARQPDTAVTRRIYFKDFLVPGCREPFSLRQGRRDDSTTSRLGDGAHPNPKSPAKGSAKHPRDFCGTLPSPSVLSCARRSQRPSSPQVLDQFVANGIRQLQNRLSTETSQLPRRVALTRRRSAVRDRQHPQKSKSSERPPTPCRLFVHYFCSLYRAAAGRTPRARDAFSATASSRCVPRISRRRVRPRKSPSLRGAAVTSMPA